MTNYGLEVINGIIQGSLYFVIESKATASPLWVKYESRIQLFLSFYLIKVTNIFKDRATVTISISDYLLSIVLQSEMK